MKIAHLVLVVASATALVLGASPLYAIWVMLCQISLTAVFILEQLDEPETDGEKSI
jgi:hypothetical protein